MIKSSSITKSPRKWLPSIVGILALFFFAGCGAKKDAGQEAGAVVMRVNLAVVTIQDPFWREQGFHSLSAVGNSRARRQEVAARLMREVSLPHAEFFFRRSWFMKPGDAVEFAKTLPAPPADAIQETYPVSWTGRIGFAAPGRFTRGHKIFHDGQITYHLSGHRTNETIPDRWTVKPGPDGGADMILRVVQGDTSVWTVIALTPADQKPAWKNR
ncbi:hypothetical protein QQ056_17005 [Oscillatoria laete-virens NRMC-F 0139]|nr:hypothetical protein [Oscillatoria laete-virens]MDL5055232.1 hypothetical protein [Oscillatoria laete-virens NRMC-F 0139]